VSGYSAKTEAPVAEGLVCRGGRRDVSAFPLRRNPGALLRMMFASPAFQWAATLATASSPRTFIARQQSSYSSPPRDAVP
jgi:hypothetical protein